MKKSKFLLIGVIFLFVVCSDKESNKNVEAGSNSIISNTNNAIKFYKDRGVFIKNNDINVLQFSRTSKIRNDDLQYLIFIPDLKILSIDGSLITDEGLKNLKTLIKLESLHLSDTKITGIGLKHLKNLNKLSLLDLNNTQVDDQALKYIKNLGNLEELSLLGTRITNAGLKYLINLKKLKSLYLDKTEVTDEGLKYLEAIDSLQYLSFKGKVTAAGIERLQKKLPNCTIEN